MTLLFFSEFVDRRKLPDLRRPVPLQRVCQDDHPVRNQRSKYNHFKTSLNLGVELREKT